MAYDFVGARAIVNGTDKASLIAGYANDWLTKLDSLYSAGKLQSYSPLDGSAYNLLDTLTRSADAVVGGLRDVRDRVRNAGENVIDAITDIANGRSTTLPNQRTPRPTQPGGGLTNPISSPSPIGPQPQFPIDGPSQPSDPIPPIVDDANSGNGDNPSSPESPSPSPSPATTTTPSPAPTTTPNFKGTEMEVTLGIWGQELDARLYQFIYTQMSAQLVRPFKVTLGGRSIRWNISQGKLPGGEAPPLGRVGGIIVESPEPEPEQPTADAGQSEGETPAPDIDLPGIGAGLLNTVENATLADVTQRVAFQYGIQAVIHPRARLFKYRYIKFDRNPLRTLATLASEAGFYLADNSSYGYAPGDEQTPLQRPGIGADGREVTSINPNQPTLVLDLDIADGVGSGIDPTDPANGETPPAPTDTTEGGTSTATPAPSSRMVPAITFRLGRSQTTQLPISDEASNDRVVVGDLGQAITVGQPTEGAQIDPETGEVVPPDGVVEGVVDEEAEEAIGGGLVQSVSQPDDTAIRRAAEIGGGGIAGQSSLIDQILGQTQPSTPRGFAPGDEDDPISQITNVANGDAPAIDLPGIGEGIDPNDPNNGQTPPPPTDTTEGGAGTGAATANVDTSAPLPPESTIPDHTSVGRGYPTNCRVLASSVTLALKPGDFVKLEDDLVPAPFNRKWRIERIRHTLDQNGFWTEIFFYLPVKIRRQTASAGSGGTSTGGGSTPGGTPQGTVGGIEELENMPSISFINPNPNGVVTSPMGPRNAPTSGASSNHRGTDVAAGEGTPLLAVTAGKVVDIGNVSGYGPYVVTIDHGSVAGQDGQTWFIGTMYGHNASASVSVGDLVQQGQEIATEGNEGVSTGPHLHINCYASPSWRVAEGAPYPSDPTVFVDIMENFVDKTFVGDGNLKGHRFTS